MPTTAEASPAEALKATSANLRGAIGEELTAGEDSHFSPEAASLLKFHGVYQQDDRDLRRELTRAGEPLEYSCMVRCSVPGGRLRREQWLAIDRLCDEVADGSLRLTSRQGVQYHFVHKGDLHRLLNRLNRGLVTTYAACGDVVRNVMVTSAPHAGRDLAQLDSLARSLANRFRPRSEAYWDLWLDGEHAVSAGPAPEDPGVTEPVYGDSYLPRKFKFGVALPGDNSIDVYSQDCGIVPIAGLDGTPGAVFIVGGGLGRSHKDPTTFPRLGDHLAWVPEEDIGEVAEALVTLFRDFGDRSDRSHARLKYVVEERGVEWVRAELERRVGHALADPVELPPWGAHRDHLGWHRQDGDTWFLGLPVPSGRLDDRPGRRRRSAIRAVLERHAEEVRITPHDNLLLCGIPGSARRDVESILGAHGVPRVEQLRVIERSTMACPALPTCGQALGEAERVLPQLLDTIDSLLAERELGDLRIETRITGCPNGCARPYVAELGIVARTKSNYDIWVGGSPAGTRLAEPVVENVPFARLAEVLAVLLDLYRDGAARAEGFGDWADRVGAPVLRAALPSFARNRAGKADR